MNGEYNFAKDIKKGEAGEMDIICFLKKYGFSILERRNDNKYDILAEYNDKLFTFEIKTDMYPKDTGNIAIEYHSRGKFSGIAETQADLFIYYFINSGEIFVMSTKVLRNLILEKKYHKKTDDSGDEGSGTKLFLFKKNLLKQHCFYHATKIEL